MSGLDLIKKTELILEKKGFKQINAKVCLCLDESGSMSDMFYSGMVSNTVDRALAVGYKFDDDGEIDVWSFSNKHVKRDPANQDQYGSYLKHKMLGGSTVYHKVLRSIAEDYYGSTSSSQVVEKASFFGKFFGKQDTVKTVVVEKDPSDLPAFVMFITDGAPDSSSEAIRGVAQVLKEYPKMFVQFIGIGYSNFDVLEELSAQNKNAAFAKINSTESDESVLDKFLNVKARQILEA